MSDCVEGFIFRPGKQLSLGTALWGISSLWVGQKIAISINFGILFGRKILAVQPHSQNKCVQFETESMYALLVSWGISGLL